MHTECTLRKENKNRCAQSVNEAVMVTPRQAEGVCVLFVYGFEKVRVRAYECVYVVGCVDVCARACVV